MKKLLLEKYGLKKWFDETFNADEKKILLDSCSDFSACEGEMNELAPAYFLANTLMWYDKKANCVICMKVAEKILELLETEKNIPIIDLHFTYMYLIKIFYKNRDYKNSYDMAVDMCNKQIEIAPQVAKEFLTNPSFHGIIGSHTGFEQLAIIEKKNKNWSQVIIVCEEAKAQGWNGDWDKRIDEAQKKLGGNK